MRMSSMTILFVALLCAAVISTSGADQARPAPAEPFAFADFSWVPGNAGSSEKPLTAGAFTGEFRLDTAYHYSFRNPKDDTISGSRPLAERVTASAGIGAFDGSPFSLR